MEPWLEAAHWRVMRLLAQRGQRVAAEAQYQRCRQVMADELGVEPDAETTALYEQIRAGKLGRVTSDKVTSDKVTSTSSVTESPNHPITLSPSHPSPCHGRPRACPRLGRNAGGRSLCRTERRGDAIDDLVGRPGGRRVPAQLITLLGMGGIGKTTLAAAVTRAVAPSFAVVIWRSLLNAPPLGELLRAWLQTLSRQRLTTLPEALDDQLRLLLTYLQQERCLLVLDNVESIFATDLSVPTGTNQPHSRAGVTRLGYEGYDHLFQRLATSEHQSCLLLTSREQPYALARVAPGPQSQPTSGRTRLLLLGGLDQQAGHLLLESAGLQTTRAAAAQLIANYSGNPLALQIVAGAIVDFFGGDVAAFQQEAGALFDGLRLVLDQQFARLSPLEREILVWLAIEREPVTVPMLRSNFVQSVATGPLLEALQALQNRSLLEKRASGFTLQNVIIEYTTEYLVEQVYREILDDKMTAPKGLPQDDKLNTTADHLVIRSSRHPVISSFLNRFALLKAQAKEYVRQSQGRLIVQPLAERLV
ncbi:MAG: BTAD domain-containing putative transcriptional regulator, partial [Caldilineaceae bacterium]